MFNERVSPTPDNPQPSVQSILQSQWFFTSVIINEYNHKFFFKFDILQKASLDSLDSFGYWFNFYP